MAEISGAPLTVVRIVGTLADPTHRRRLDALAGAHGRLAALTSPSDAGPAGDPAEAIWNLAATGRIAVEGDGPWQLAYIPSHTALTGVAEGEQCWGAAVDGKQRKAIRWLTGALFRLPLHDGSGEVAAFITDWSPFPAACAVAVHPNHELAGGGATPYFAGRFVRHPLVGDLLPVWVADWVKPEFGTGAVIVNPAHSAADLEFARAVGLPVRFGLADRPPVADASTWPEPPVVKSGVAVRTGNFDGLDPVAAADAYFATLAAGGFASPAKVPLLGRHVIGLASADAAGILDYDAAVRRFTGGVPVTVVTEPAVELALDPPAHLLVTPEAVIQELLWIRLLRADLGITGRPSRVTVVQKADLGKAGEAPEAALVAAGPPDQVVTVKPQLVEQVQRLVDEHNAVLSQAKPDGEPSATGRKTIESLRVGDLPLAFKHVYGLHKELRRGEAAGDATAYALAVHVLLGVDLPGWLSPDQAAKALA